jgi:hypothetical protein
MLGSSSSSEPVGPEVEAAVNRSQDDHIWYPGRSGYALVKARRSGVAWWIEAESKGNRMGNCNTPGVYILLDNEYGFKHVISVDKTDFKF